MIDKNQFEILEALSLEYSNVVIIFDVHGNMPYEVYVVQDFRNSDSNLHYHSLRGFKNVTHVIQGNSTYTNINRDILLGVVTKIENMDYNMNERKYSANGFSWIRV